VRREDDMAFYWILGAAVFLTIWFGMLVAFERLKRIEKMIEETRNQVREIYLQGIEAKVERAELTKAK
jgi:uncharacterized membrane protein (DUF106 family)